MKNVYITEGVIQRDLPCKLRHVLDKGCTVLDVCTIVLSCPTKNCLVGLVLVNSPRLSGAFSFGTGGTSACAFSAIGLRRESLLVQFIAPKSAEKICAAKNFAQDEHDRYVQNTVLRNMAYRRL